MSSKSKKRKQTEYTHRVNSIEFNQKAKRSRMEQLEDRIVSTFGTTEFLISNLLFFIGWITINSGLIYSIKPFDPFPFVLLITIVSLEAIILAIFVLITQNRQSKISSLRQEAELHVNIVTEKEVTKILKLLIDIRRKLESNYHRDPELKRMIKPLNPRKIESQIEKQLGKK